MAASICCTIGLRLAKASKDFFAQHCLHSLLDQPHNIAAVASLLIHLSAGSTTTTRRQLSQTRAGYGSRHCGPFSGSPAAPSAATSIRLSREGPNSYMQHGRMGGIFTPKHAFSLWGTSTALRQQGMALFSWNHAASVSMELNPQFLHKDESSVHILLSCQTTSKVQQPVSCLPGAGPCKTLLTGVYFIIRMVSWTHEAG